MLYPCRVNIKRLFHNKYRGLDFGDLSSGYSHEYSRPTSRLIILVLDNRIVLQLYAITMLEETVAARMGLYVLMSLLSCMGSVFVG